MFVSPSNAYVEILMPSVIVLGGEDFGKWLGHECGAFMYVISALRETAQSSPVASAMCVQL